MTFCLLLAGNTINHSLIWLLHILENKGKINQLELLSFFFSATSSPVLTGEWEVSVEKSLDALVSSCVVVPCSFTPPRKNIQTSRLRGIWLLSDKENQRIYHEDDSEVMENFRGRTKIGPLIEKNCTLEMTKVKDHDNGPFCFRVEVVEMNKSVSDAFTFHDCVTLTMLCMSPPIFLLPYIIFYAVVIALIINVQLLHLKLIPQSLNWLLQRKPSKINPTPSPVQLPTPAPPILPISHGAGARGMRYPEIFIRATGRWCPSLRLFPVKRMTTVTSPAWRNLMAGGHHLQHWSFT